LRGSRRAVSSGNITFSSTVFHGRSEFLKNHHAVGTGLDDLAAVNPHLAFAGLQIAADGLEQRGLATARGAEQHKTIRAIDRKGDAFGRRDHRA
jgi:hypothetical protein